MSAVLFTIILKNIPIKKANKTRQTTPGKPKGRGGRKAAGGVLRTERGQAGRRAPRRSKHRQTNPYFQKLPPLKQTGSWWGIKTAPGFFTLRQPRSHGNHLHTRRRQLPEKHTHRREPGDPREVRALLVAGSSCSSPRPREGPEATSRTGIGRSVCR